MLVPRRVSELLVSDIVVYNISDTNLRQAACRMRYASDAIGTAVDPYCIIIHNYFENVSYTPAELIYTPAELIGLVKHGIQLLVHQFQVTEEEMMEKNAMVQEVYEQILARAPQFRLDELSEQDYFQPKLSEMSNGKIKL